MRIHPFFIPAFTIGLLVGTVAVAQAAGQWSTSGRTAADLTALTPADLKGWMTLQQVAEGLGLEVAELYAVAAIPAEIPPATALKDLEALIPGFEVSALRDQLAVWQAGATAPPTATAPPPTPAVATPTVAPAPHAGAGAGAGPTPLPPGQVLPADQIKGRMTLTEVSAQCAVPLPALLTALGLPETMDPATPIRDLLAQGLITEVAQVQAAVAALQGRP